MDWNFVLWANMAVYLDQCSPLKELTDLVLCRILSSSILCNWLNFTSSGSMLPSSSSPVSYGSMRAELLGVIKCPATTTRSTTRSFTLAWEVLATLLTDLWVTFLQTVWSHLIEDHQTSFMTSLWWYYQIKGNWDTALGITTTFCQ